jgi:hypothetical protein
LQTKLTNSARELEKEQREDFTGLMKVALRLFEQRYRSILTISSPTNYSLLALCACAHSNDVQWVHVLRIVYRCVPNKAILTVEALLESIFAESVQLATLLLSALEDTAVHVGAAVVCGRYKKRTTISIANESVPQYDGVPVVSHYDIRLALILTRAVFVAGQTQSALGRDLPVTHCV